MLPAPSVSVSEPDAPNAGPAIAQITIPYTTSQPLTVDYSMYTQTFTMTATGDGGYTATGNTLSQAGSGSVTIPAGSDEADVTLPGTYNDPSQPVETLISVSLPGEAVPDSANIAYSNGVFGYDLQAWPINVYGDQTAIAVTTTTTTYGGVPGVFELTRSGDTSEPLLLTPYGDTTGNYIVTSENGVSAPGVLSGTQMALDFPPGVATIDVDIAATAASTYAGGDIEVDFGGGDGAEVFRQPWQCLADD